MNKSNLVTEAELSTIAPLPHNIVHISQYYINGLSDANLDVLLTRVTVLERNCKNHATLAKSFGEWHVGYSFYNQGWQHSWLKATFATLQEAINFIYALRNANAYMVS